MRHLAIPLIFTLMLLAGYACTERIDVDLGTTYSRLVVDGALTSDTTVHTIRLTQTADYYSNKPALAVRGASVSITDGTQTIMLTENPNRPGYYETNNQAFGIAGNTYRLVIQLPVEINGHDFYEASSYMPTVVPLDSIKLNTIPQWNVVAVGTYALDPPSTDYYLFNVYKNGELLSDTINKVFLTDDKFFNGSYTNGAPAAFLFQDNPREKIIPGDTVTLQIAGITRDYYYFLTELLSSSGFNNPLFGGPPANISGNVSNGAIGFFTAYSVKYSTVIAR
jgi:hypothetical protein